MYGYNITVLVCIDISVTCQWSHRHWALRVCDDSLDVTSLLIVVSILRMDDVSATPDPEEGHPTDLPRSPPPPPGSYSYSVPPSSFPTSRWAFGLTLFSRPTRSAARRLFTARFADWCACSKLNTLKRFDYNFLYVRFGVWTKTEIFEPRLAVVFNNSFFFFSLFDIT